MTVCNLIYLLIIMYHTTWYYVPQNARAQNYLYYFYKTSKSSGAKSLLFAS